MGFEPLSLFLERERSIVRAGPHPSACGAFRRVRLHHRPRVTAPIRADGYPNGYPRLTRSPRADDTSARQDHRGLRGPSRHHGRSAGARGDVTDAGPRVCPGVAAPGRDGRRPGPRAAPVGPRVAAWATEAHAEDPALAAEVPLANRSGAGARGRDQYERPNRPVTCATCSGHCKPKRSRSALLTIAPSGRPKVTCRANVQSSPTIT